MTDRGSALQKYMKYNKILFIGIAWIMFFSFAGEVSAGNFGVGIDPALYPGGAPTIDNTVPVIAPPGSTAPPLPPQDPDSIRIFFTMRIVNAVLGIAGVVAIFFILNNAFYMIASAGSEEKITQHKKGLMWALVGLVLIILSYSIIRFIVSVPFQAGEAPPAAAETAP